MQRAFKLAGLIPSAEVLIGRPRARCSRMLREAREQLGAAPRTPGSSSRRVAPENLPKLKQTLASVHEARAEIGNGALMKLTAALVERLDKMPAVRISEAARDGIRDGAAARRERVREFREPVAGFPEAGRGDARARSTPRSTRGPAAAARRRCWTRCAKRAQERVLLAQVGREIQANLRHMEQVLDAFFRDNAKRAELATLAKDSQQIRGALSILGLDDAERLLELCQQQIDDVCRIRTRRCRTRISSSSPNRCRAWASTSRRSSSSGPTATV